MCVISAPLFFFCWHCLQPLFGFSSVLASLFHCCSFAVVFLYCQLLMCVIYLHLFNTGVTFTDSRWRHAARQISLPSTFSIHFYSFVVQPNKWLYLAVMCPSHFCRVRVESDWQAPRVRVESESQAPRVRVESESSKIFSSRVRVMTWSSRVRVESRELSSHENCRVTSSHWFASWSQCRVTRSFTFSLQHFFAMK